MPMDAGDETVQPGTLAEAIYDAIAGEAWDPGGDFAINQKKFSSIMANAIVDHIVANADVTIATGDAGLQRDPVSPFTDTLGPSADKTLTGAVS